MIEDKDENEKIIQQNLTISRKLNTHNICEINGKYINKIDKISNYILTTILSNNFIKGSDMKAVLCVFDTLFLSTSIKKDGLWVLNEKVKNTITNVKKISRGRYGTIYNVTFFSNIQLVIKFPLIEEEDNNDYYKEQTRNSLIREYYIGVKAMNNLRYIVPNFVYTLGGFVCDDTEKSDELCQNSFLKSSPSILYENIPGKTVTDLINSLNFDQWLVIFFQLLLALEVAQRQVQFTHFDLHDSNVMLRKKSKFTYSVPLDMSTYTVTNPEFIPIIIDFGFSSCRIDNETIGTYRADDVGILNYMVPGYDMYKFMSYCCEFSENIDLKKKIALLFRFYQTDNPYPINIVTRVNPKTNERKEYVEKLLSIVDTFQKIPVTKVGTYTPLMFMEWLLKEYPDELKPYINVSDRTFYLPIEYSIMIKKYNDIFNYPQKGIEQSVSLIRSCIIEKPSYVVTKYMSTMLEKYNKNLGSLEVKLIIKEIEMYLLKNEKKLIDLDMSMLYKVFTIKTPLQDELDECAQVLLNLKIYLPVQIRRFVTGEHPSSYKFDYDTIQKTTDKLSSLLTYDDEIQSYMQMYFSILELKLDDKFNDWIDMFKKSDIYHFYTHNHLRNIRLQRWAKTLLSSSQNDKKLL